MVGLWWMHKVKMELRLNISLALTLPLLQALYF